MSPDAGQVLPTLSIRITDWILSRVPLVEARAQRHSHVKPQRDQLLRISVQRVDLQRIVRLPLSNQAPSPKKVPGATLLARLGCLQGVANAQEDLFKFVKSRASEETMIVFIILIPAERSRTLIGSVEQLLFVRICYT